MKSRRGNEGNPTSHQAHQVEVPTGQLSQGTFISQGSESKASGTSPECLAALPPCLKCDTSGLWYCAICPDCHGYGRAAA